MIFFLSIVAGVVNSYVLVGVMEDAKCHTIFHYEQNSNV